MSNEADEPQGKFPDVEYAEFLEQRPAYHPVLAQNFWTTGSGGSVAFNTREILFLCEDKTCKGMRCFEFSGSTGRISNKDGRNELFLEYQCKNCEKTKKSFSILTFGINEGGAALIVKLGEWPPFGPKTPSRLLRLLNSDRDLFLRGRRAERHGLGIGAFTYYRRVVENQKNRLIDEIIKVVQKVEVSPEAIVADLTKAKKTFQFSKAMADVKLGVPQILLINGHNPLTLLHSALSAGIHDKSDDDCLEIAKNIRLVLAGLAERFGQALSERKELNDAVTTLLKATKGKADKKDSQL